MKGDPVSIIEAAYADFPDEQDWVRGIADAARPCLDMSFGVSAFTYDATVPSALRIPAGAGVGRGAFQLGQMQAMAQELEPMLVTRAYAPGPPMYLNQLIKELNADRVPGVSSAERQVTSAGYGDVLAVRGTDPSMRGCMIVVGRQGLGKLSRSGKRMLSCIAAHLASGFRLRSARPRPDQADAVLDSRGHFLHASVDDALAHRENLGRALEKRTRARETLRKEDSSAAVQLWQAMVEGEWTLVDHIDTDGKRFVLARRNRPGVPEIGALVLRERQVAAYAAFGYSLKHIAYELGLAPTTVSTHLKSALRKLRMASQAELAAVMASKSATLTRRAPSE